MKLVAKLKRLRHLLYQFRWRCHPLQENKVILWADNFKSFGCSPKQIALELINRGGYDVVWVLEHGRPAPEIEGLRIVRYFSMEYLREISTAKFIVCNHRTTAYHYFWKRPGQFYIQTWHGGLALKRIEADAPMLPDEYVEAAKLDSKKIDLLLSGFTFTTQMYRRAFWYDGEILECGTPRCDVLFADTAAAKQKVYGFYGIPTGKKFALYAPTFRKNKQADVFGMDFAKLQDVLGEDWCIGCRLHPNLNVEIADDTAISMSKYPDMQELLCACDLLITDYSSSMFDMAVAGKPCVLYVPDLQQYIDEERGLYFDISELPFPVAHCMEELCQTQFEKNEVKYADFLTKVGSAEKGNAASAVVDRLAAERDKLSTKRG